MTDLVQRLRESIKACRALDRSALLAEAAAEIERLRGEEPAAWLYERDDGSQFASVAYGLHREGTSTSCWLKLEPLPLYLRRV